MSYSNLSLPKEMAENIEKLITEHPELGFTSTAEFIKNAIRSYHYYEILFESDKRKVID